MRILVTGGAGFIGSHVTDAFVERGHDVLVLDSLWEHGGGRRQNVPQRASFVHLDIRDENAGRVFQEFRPEVVSHHAAQHSVAISARDPKYDADVNVLGLINILENSVKSGVRKVLFASSGATFGTPEHLPIDERTPQRPESPYGITKMVAEYYLRYYRDAHGLDFTALRYGNVYGPRQDPNGEAGVISVFIDRFLTGQSVRIDWDGEQTRDYIYVKDVAAANRAALERGGGGMYCIGTGRRTSVNEVYRMLSKISGTSPELIRAPKRSGDVRDAQYDPSLANHELDWQAATSLEQGLSETYDYFREAIRVASR